MVHHATLAKNHVMVYHGSMVYHSSYHMVLPYPQKPRHVPPGNYYGKLHIDTTHSIQCGYSVLVYHGNYQIVYHTVVFMVYHR